MFRSRTANGYSPRVLSELGTAELFVVSSLRLWFLAHCDPDCHYPDWRQAFARAEIGALGVWGFDRLCRTMGTTAVRTLDVHWLHCGHLGEYEVCVLRTLALLQRKRLEEAETALLEWCPPAAVRLALEAAHAFATALCSHRLWLATSEGEAASHRRCELTSTIVPTAAGSALLH
jgi:hypothetical protein